VVIGARARASFLGVPVSLKRLLAGGVEAAGGATQREADAERPTSTATLLTHLASALLDRGDSKAAVEALRSAIRLNPKLGEAYYEMGRAVRPYPEKKKRRHRRFPFECCSGTGPHQNKLCARAIFFLFSLIMFVQESCYFTPKNISRWIQLCENWGGG
jgi:tetratricopeptide (TPR) repeat protein